MRSSSPTASLRATTGARDHRMFGGRLHRRNLPLLPRFAVWAVRLEGDYRDWAEIRTWAESIAAELTTAQEAPRP